MVDVGRKRATDRECIARGHVTMSPTTIARIADGTMPKGDVLATARLAGILATKRTAEWIPLAHPLPIEGIEVVLLPDAAAGHVQIEARVRTHAKTGVEMEALVAVAAAGLTLYDMCKAIDRAMVIEAVRLVSKRGGKSGTWQREGEPTDLAGARAVVRGPNRRPRPGVRVQ
jgi:cyclic pyranopterin phosphate synthase